jgi:lysozyme
MRKRWLLAIGAVATLAVAAAAGRYVWLPEYRPSLRPGESYGIDVSHHQGPIDWRRVARDGISFAYVKATEGGDHVDTRFAENWAGAAGAGLRRGAYHFFTLCVPGEAQARNFAGVVGDAPMLPPAVDLELAGNCSARPPAADVERELRAFLTVVEQATGHRAVLYVGDDFAGRYFRDVDGREQWVPRPLRRPGGDWVMWQVSGFAHVHGIDGPVDLDVGRFR